MIFALSYLRSQNQLFFPKYLVKSKETLMTMRHAGRSWVDGLEEFLAGPSVPEQDEANVQQFNVQKYVSQMGTSCGRSNFSPMKVQMANVCRC